MHTNTNIIIILIAHVFTYNIDFIASTQYSIISYNAGNNILSKLLFEEVLKYDCFIYPEENYFIYFVRIFLEFNFQKSLYYFEAKQYSDQIDKNKKGFF